MFTRLVRNSGEILTLGAFEHPCLLLDAFNNERQLIASHGFPKIQNFKVCVDGIANIRGVLCIEA